MKAKNVNVTFVLHNSVSLLGKSEDWNDTIKHISTVLSSSM